jgi:hypothetical protein
MELISTTVVQIKREDDREWWEGWQETVVTYFNVLPGTHQERSAKITNKADQKMTVFWDCAM